MSALDGFEARSFSWQGKERTVHWRGEGPGVVVIHEVPGITPEVAGYGRELADAGFTAVLPVLFGTAGAPMTASAVARSFAQVCVSREFRLLAGGQTSPVCEWLRALCRHVHTERGGPGVGAVGMCLTGGFALALMVDESVMAPVLAQPSLPFPIGRGAKRSLGLGAADLARVKERDVPVVGLRFTADVLCPAERFARLGEELGDRFEAVEIDSSPGNDWGIPRRAHSVLTADFVDETGHPTRQARDRVLAFFADRLATG